MSDDSNPHGRPVHTDTDRDRNVDTEPHAVRYANVATVRYFDAIIDRYLDRAANTYPKRYNHNDSYFHADSYKYLNGNTASIEDANAGCDQHPDANTDTISDSERNQHANADGDCDGHGNPDTGCRSDL